MLTAALGAFVFAGCGLIPEARTGTIADLHEWSPTAQLSEDGTVLIATYEGWPMAETPLVYACAEEPANVFGGDPVHFLPADEPGCAPYDVVVDGDTLRISIDRASLPEALTNLESWSLVMGLERPEGRWSMVSPAIVVFPDLLKPRPSEPEASAA